MWRGVERGSTAHTSCCCLKYEKNEGNRTTEGMIENSNLLAAALTVASLMSLTLLCLRCKKKSKIIHEEVQIYNPQTFQRGGSRFAVTQSKPVTRTNQITSITDETTEDYEEFPSDAMDESDYQNITEAQTGSPEHTYVAPLADSLYENEEMRKNANLAPSVYGNIDAFPNGGDDDDYENADFLELAGEEEDDEPDYVNECT
ncbi:LAT2 domain-containing protein isoform X2 [Thunnus albacares]|uniref:LAT2 domain-containing protein isoform X2 n=1 Tax=Thunnus albacares TaxID=8236 RepID=UPI001CF66132|nr:LAT2 domain-containing protein isoform X2 [Thunnus albacares]